MFVQAAQKASSKCAAIVVRAHLDASAAVDSGGQARGSAAFMPLHAPNAWKRPGYKIAHRATDIEAA
ncbi:MAG: hypothetical protein C5B50_18300 [Verrucomicrobia bacterium]|nr:MAG: hypothetical protein C5B50_18300 [Verrucomicrobiota bacterium]